jgi:hypothetical protein
MIHPTHPRKTVHRQKTILTIVSGPLGVQFIHIRSKRVDLDATHLCATIFTGIYENQPIELANNSIHQSANLRSQGSRRPGWEAFRLLMNSGIRKFHLPKPPSAIQSFKSISPETWNL